MAQNGLPCELPIGTVVHGTLNAGSTTTKTFAARGDRIRISTSSGGRVRIRVDGTNPDAGTVGIKADQFGLLVDGEEKVIDLVQSSSEIRVHAIDTLADLMISLSDCRGESRDSDASA